MEMNKKIVTFMGYEKLGKTGRLPKVMFHFRVIDSSFKGTPEEENKAKDHYINVNITESVACCWNLDKNDDRIKVLFEFGKRHLIEKIKDGTLNEEEEFSVQSQGYCPFDPAKIKMINNGSFEVEVLGKPLMQEEEEIKFASSIIDVRDNINALFKDKYGEKLLLLEQERNLLELFRSANSQEEFSFRLTALGNLVGSLNVDVLRKITQISNSNIKTISLLNEFIKTITGKEHDLIKVFRNINQMRQGYPVHGDNVDGIKEAYDFFRLTYPLVDFKEAWKGLLKKYLFALKNLLEIIKSI
jgi:hypothetical protein